MRRLRPIAGNLRRSRTQARDLHDNAAESDNSGLHWYLCYGSGLTRVTRNVRLSTTGPMDATDPNTVSVRRDQTFLLR